MAADEEIWNGRRGILTLVNEASWTLEQAIFDMLHRRDDMDRLLAGKLITQSHLDTSGERNQRGNKRAYNQKCPGKGKGKWQDKGKGNDQGKWQQGKWQDKGKSKGAKTKTKSWPANWTNKNIGGRL